VPPVTSARPALKRALDIVGAAILLGFTLPLLAVALLLIWLDGGRPLIHRRRVVGLGGREFDAFKLRTMVPDADRTLERDESLRSSYGLRNKLIVDPRVTRVGRCLRAFSIDELPQLANVLRGEMSLVGPRMITAAELPEWGEVADLRLTVRPGITGSWQVGGRQTLTKEQRIQLDAEYLRCASFWLDVRILLKTIPAVLSRRGSY
jgi:lipopolysaccharide/colanic/teichoic acid biosynthesis glycosyltransferase